jgi:hypothetical protein
MTAHHRRKGARLYGRGLYHLLRIAAGKSGTKNISKLIQVFASLSRIHLMPAELAATISLLLDASKLVER